MASRPIRIALCDEIDRFPASAGAEGDPVSLVAKRTTTFWNRKIIKVSTPTIKGSSRIMKKTTKIAQWKSGASLVQVAKEYQPFSWKQIRV
ncbi:phage terminase large subunit family protein [Paenibacillus larvae]|nr:phage terminase large subunit family protein [Paenibacillus larvae]MDT2239104.1 phage terminase large subunit family protein [Paenibacillus larvae]